MLAFVPGRTEHLPAITVPTVFTHGTSDPFGTPEELNAAATAESLTPSTRPA
ncbi:hypothetical protein MAHJHV63_49910 [Mycobacterium avium subsp. hominissuis]